MTYSKFLLFGVVASQLPRLAVSMETKNGYLCNLCHSLQNEYPYPPPSAEQKVVRFSESEDEKFGLPRDRGETCIEVWNTVLDFANPNIKDETSCRSMAQAYATQCCNDVIDEAYITSGEEVLQISKEENDILGEASVISLTHPQHYGIASRVRNVNSENIVATRSSVDRLSSSSMGNRSNVDNDGENDNGDGVSIAQPLSGVISNEGSLSNHSTNRLSSSSMGTGRDVDSSQENDRSIGKTSSVFYLRGR